MATVVRFQGVSSVSWDGESLKNLTGQPIHLWLFALFLDREKSAFRGHWEKMNIPPYESRIPVATKPNALLVLPGGLTCRDAEVRANAYLDGVLERMGATRQGA